MPEENLDEIPGSTGRRNVISQEELHNMQARDLLQYFEKKNFLRKKDLVKRTHALVVTGRT